jgi:hypothetical protein
MAPKIRGRNGASTNWCGYAVTGSDCRYVRGTWNVPDVAQNPAGLANTYSSVWVGIDGDNSSTVEQCGTEQDYLSTGKRFYAWYEMYPKGSVVLNTSTYSVAPGNKIEAEVKYTGGGSFKLTLMNVTKGWSFSTTQRLNQARRTSAEWIAEAPWWGGVLPLANFNSVLLSNCLFATGNNPTAGLYGVRDLPTTDRITMVSSSDGTTPKAIPGNVAQDNSFSIDWAGYQ